MLQTSSRQSRVYNHHLVSALHNGPIGQAYLRLVFVLRDQSYLAGAVTEDTRITLADDIIEHTAGLSRNPEDAQPELDLHSMVKHSLIVRLPCYNSPWSNDLLAILATPQPCFAGSSRD